MRFTLPAEQVSSSKSNGFDGPEVIDRLLVRSVKDDPKVVGDFGATPKGQAYMYVAYARRDIEGSRRGR